jgi:hypothetical protein
MDDVCNAADDLERRDYFRVDDVLPVLVRKLPDHQKVIRSRFISGQVFRHGLSTLIESTPQDSANVQLMRALVEINSKLDLILHKLDTGLEGLDQAENQQVSLSASGIRLTVREDLRPGDLTEIKICLAFQPPIWIVVYGRVTRSEPLDDRCSEVALCFCELDDEIRDTINHYTMKRQRELIRRQRGYDE